MRIELTSINLGGEITLVGSPRSKLRLCNVESPRYVCMYIHGYQEWSNVVCVGIKSRDTAASRQASPWAITTPASGPPPLLYSRVTEPVDIFPGLSTRVIIIFHPSIDSSSDSSISRVRSGKRERENCSRNTFREHLARCLRRSNYRRTTDKYLLTWSCKGNGNNIANKPQNSPLLPIISSPLGKLAILQIRYPDYYSTIPSNSLYIYVHRVGEHPTIAITTGSCLTSHGVASTRSGEQLEQERRAMTVL